MTEPVHLATHPTADGHLIGILTLDSPASLNALSLPMIRQALLVMFGLSQMLRLALVLVTGQFTPASLIYAVLAVPLLFLVTRGNRHYPLNISPAAVSRVAAALLLMAGVSLIVTAW